MARARGDAAAARAELEALLVEAPRHYDGRVELAALLAGSGEAAELPGALGLLVEARRLAPGRPEAHHLLRRLTGPASPAPPQAGREALLARALAHPYDPAAGVAAARALLDEDETEAAVRWLRSVYWLGDLDPQATAEATALLREHDPRWQGRRVVPVFVWVDEPLRADPWWSMRVRLLWSNTSRALHPLLQTVFLPVALRGFESAGAGDRLDGIQAAAAAAGFAPPTEGIAAVLTGRTPRAGVGSRRLGQAEFLGEWLSARLEPGVSTDSHTLLHEVLHLYGAVHVSPDVDSLMNPSGESRTLDVPNSQIAHRMAGRGFTRAGWDRDVLGAVDAQGLEAAYRAALALNLDARQQGMLEAIEAAKESRYLGARQARQASDLDEHLGDVARFLARLALADGRPAAAAGYLELASRLVGPSSAEGRALRSRARQLRTASP